MGGAKIRRQVFGAAFAVLCAGMPLGSVGAQAVYSGIPDDPVIWPSRDGKTRYRLVGPPAQALNCFASDLAYSEESWAIDAKEKGAPEGGHLATQLTEMDALVIADWQKEIGRLLGAAAADYPPDELLHGAELMKDDWRETGESFARALLSDLSSDQTPAEYRRAFAHYKNCGSL